MADDLIASMITFVATNLETIPDHLNCLIDSNGMSSELVLIKLKLEIFRIKLLPKDHELSQ